MRNTYASTLYVLSSSLTIFFFVFSGCAPVEIKKITAQKDYHYKFTSQNAGLKISVDPYREEQRLQDFFGCDLLSRKLLPVLVVIDNLSAEDGYVLLKEQSRLLMKTADTVAIEDKESYRSSDELRKAVKEESAINIVAGGIGVIAPITLIASLPLMIAAEKTIKDELAIQTNIQEKQLLDKTLYRGASHSGFLYFPLNSKEDSTRVGGFSLSIRNIRTKEVVSFIIDVE